MDLLTRLSLRTLGLLPQVKPVTAPRFGPYDPAPMAGPNSPDPLGSPPPDREDGAFPPVPPDDRPHGKNPLITARPPASGPVPKLTAAFEETLQPGHAKIAEPRPPAGRATTRDTTGGPRAADPLASDSGHSGQVYGVMPQAPPESRPDHPGPSSDIDGSRRILKETPLPPGPRRSRSPAAPPAGRHQIRPQNDAAAPELPVRSGQFTLQPPEHPNQRLVPDRNSDAAGCKTAFQGDRRIPLAAPDRAAHPPPIAPAEPTIQVSIGRIEIRAITPPAAPHPERPPKAGVLTLDQYLQKRSN
jgi:hypothetical protein